MFLPYFSTTHRLSFNSGKKKKHKNYKTSSSTLQVAPLQTTSSNSSSQPSQLAPPSIPFCYAQLGVECQPTISYLSLKRAQTTIDDFVRSYFFFHSLDPLEILKHFPLLIFVECTIYQMDEENEALANLGVRDSSVKLQGAEVLRKVLEREGMLDARVEQELVNGQEYWRRERALCMYIYIDIATIYLLYLFILTILLHFSVNSLKYISFFICETLLVE